MILVIGYGNTLRTDDGAGVRLAEWLGRGPLRAFLRVVTAQQLTPEMALEVAAADVTEVVFTDAALDAKGPSVRPVVRGASAAPGHVLLPENLMDLAEALYGRRVPGWVVAIPARRLDCGTGLSLPAAEDLARTAELVTAFLAGMVRARAGESISRRVSSSSDLADPKMTVSRN